MNKKNTITSALFLIILIFFAIENVKAQEVYFFSEGTDNTFYDQGIVDKNNLGESLFEFTHPPGGPQWNDKVPCSTIAYKGNSSLKFSYKSSENGNWRASIYRPGWAIADISALDSLSFYLFSTTGFPKSALPQIALKAVSASGSGESTSAFYKLSEYNDSVVPNRWVKISIPLIHFFSNDTQLDFSKVKGVIFNQSEKNNVSRILFIDEIVAFRKLAEIPVVNSFSVQGFDSHAELNWVKPMPDLNYRIYASFNNGQSFQLRGETSENHYFDFVPPEAKNKTAIFRVVSVFQGSESAPAESSATLKDFTDEELLEMVQQYTFRYFWEGAHPQTGMTLERSNSSGKTAASGATGMGLMAMIVAHEREYRPRDEIKGKIIQILEFLEKCEKHHGAWSHWYNADTYKTQPFSSNDDGGDIVETSYVAQGLIAIKNYFTGTDTKSVLIRQKADKLWKEIDWDWYRKFGENVLYWHWSPNYDFQKNMKVSGWNECLVTYIMAASSPTYGVPEEVYSQGWARSGNMANKRSFYNLEISLAPNWGGPLFFTHYSHLGINPKGLRDKYADYWVEHVNTTLIHYEYAKANPLGHRNYSENCWGLTASDDPFGYSAHRPQTNDNGTISPTAALSAFPYTPHESMKALKYFYRERGSELFGKYGFYDAFNDNLGWVKEAYLGIDQGPIIVMIENYRTGLLWKNVMKDADVKSGLIKLGFDFSTMVTGLKSAETVNLFPNPAQAFFEIELTPAFQNQTLFIEIYSLEGKLMCRTSLFSNTAKIRMDCTGLENGLYVVEITNSRESAKSKLIIQNQ